MPLSQLQNFLRRISSHLLRAVSAVSALLSFSIPDPRQFSSWSSVLEGALLSSFDSEQERTPNGEWRRETPLPARRHRVNALYAPSCEERGESREEGNWRAGWRAPPPPPRRLLARYLLLLLLFALSLFFFTFAPSATVETSASACVTDPERPRDRVRRRRRRAQPPGGRPDDPEVAPGPRPDPQVSPPGRFFART